MHLPSLAQILSKLLYAPKLALRVNSVYENAFNKFERDLRAEEGIANELDYVEQISWVLFLKYLDDFESERRDRAELVGEDYTAIILGRGLLEQLGRTNKGR